MTRRKIPESCSEQSSIIIAAKQCPHYDVKATLPLLTNGNPTAAWFMHLLKARDGKHGNENYVLRFHHTLQARLDPAMITELRHRSIMEKWETCRYNLRTNLVPAEVFRARQPTVHRHEERYLSHRLPPCRMLYGTWDRILQRVSTYYTEKGCRATALYNVVPRNPRHPRFDAEAVLRDPDGSIKISNERFFRSHADRERYGGTGFTSILELLVRTRCLTVHLPPEELDDLNLMNNPPPLPSVPVIAKTEPRSRSVALDAMPAAE